MSDDQSKMWEVLRATGLTPEQCTAIERCILKK